MDLEGLLRPVVERDGTELVEVSLARERGRRMLRVTVDRDGGIDLDTIAELSERIARRLDLEGFQPGPYSLEVSSPGVERPLRRPSDFAKRLGEKVRVKTSRPVEGASRIVGTIAATGDEGVTIATETGERTVGFADIVSARTVFEWGNAGNAKEVKR